MCVCALRTHRFRAIPLFSTLSFMSSLHRFRSKFCLNYNLLLSIPSLSILLSCHTREGEKRTICEWLVSWKSKIRKRFFSLVFPHSLFSLSAISVLWQINDTNFSYISMELYACMRACVCVLRSLVLRFFSSIIYCTLYDWINSISDRMINQTICVLKLKLKLTLNSTVLFRMLLFVEMLI